MSRRVTRTAGRLKLERSALRGDRWPAEPARARTRPPGALIGVLAPMDDPRRWLVGLPMN